MGYSNSVYKAASDILHERRLNAEKAAERRKEEVYERFPRVKELEKQISMSGIKTARAVLAGGDVKVEVEKLRDKDLARSLSRSFSTSTFTSPPARTARAVLIPLMEICFSSSFTRGNLSYTSSFLLSAAFSALSLRSCNISEAAL